MEQLELVSVLKEIVFSEREVESAKIELALKSDFNLLDAFRMIDVRNLGCFTAHDMMEGLNRNLSFSEFSSDDIFMFFKRMDRQGHARLNFNEFSSAVLPFSREYAALVTDRPDYYCNRGTDFTRFFALDTRREMQAYWSAMLRGERQMEALRLRLAQRPYYNEREAFEFCSRQRPG